MAPKHFVAEYRRLSRASASCRERTRGYIDSTYARHDAKRGQRSGEVLCIN